MVIALRRPLMALSAALACWILGGCAATAPPLPPPPPPPAEPKIPSAADDWRALGVAQFGSQLQDLHVPVHEVLLFRDRQDADSAAEPADQECYAPEAPSRRFLGRDAASYLLCYAGGRLDSVEVTVNLTAAGAAAEFSRYCDGWQAGTVYFAPRTADQCSGKDQRGPSFRASLGESADGLTVPLSIVVSGISHPESP
jgi:hypothetical protein